MPSKLLSAFRSHQKMRLVAVLWTILIFVACLIPGREVPHVSIPLADKWVHLIIFAGFSFLWLCTIKAAGAKAGWLMLLLSLALGYTVELLQGSGITTGRSYDLYDVLADGIGGALGILLFYPFRNKVLRTP